MPIAPGVRPVLLAEGGFTEEGMGAPGKADQAFAIGFAVGQVGGIDQALAGLDEEQFRSQFAGLAAAAVRQLHGRFRPFGPDCLLEFSQPSAGFEPAGLQPVAPYMELQIRLEGEGEDGRAVIEFQGTNAEARPFQQQTFRCRPIFQCLDARKARLDAEAVQPVAVQFPDFEGRAACLDAVPEIAADKGGNVTGDAGWPVEPAGKRARI